MKDWERFMYSEFPTMDASTSGLVMTTYEFTRQAAAHCRSLLEIAFNEKMHTSEEGASLKVTGIHRYSDISVDIIFTKHSPAEMKKLEKELKSFWGLNNDE